MTAKARRQSRSSLATQLLGILVAAVILGLPSQKLDKHVSTNVLRYSTHTSEDEVAYGRRLWQTMRLNGGPPTAKGGAVMLAHPPAKDPLVTILSADNLGTALDDNSPLILYSRRAYARLHGYRCRLIEELGWDPLQAIRAAMYTAGEGELLVWMHNHSFIGDWRIRLVDEWRGLGSPDISFLFAQGTTTPLQPIGGRMIVRHTASTVALFDKLLAAGGSWQGSLWSAYHASPVEGSAISWVASPTKCADVQCSHRRTESGSLLDFSGHPYLRKANSTALNAAAYASVLALPHPLVPVVVSGSDASHGWSAVQLLDTVHATNPRLRVIFWDFGLTPQQRSYIESHPSLLPPLRSFPFHEYPSHVNISTQAGQYAWKPASIAQVLEMHPVVLWLDAGCVVRGPLTPAWAYILEEGMMSTASSGKVSQYTHAGMRQFYTDIGDWAFLLGKYAHQFNGALIGVHRDSGEYSRIFLPWLRCALEPACIAPPGSSRENHRQDQAALSVLMYAADKVWVYPSAIPVEYHFDTGKPPARGSIVASLLLSSTAAAAAQEEVPLPTGAGAAFAPAVPQYVTLPAAPVPLELYAHHLPAAVSLVWLPSAACTSTAAARASVSASLAQEATVEAATEMMQLLLNPTVIFVLSDDETTATSGAAQLRSAARDRKVLSTRVTILGLSLSMLHGLRASKGTRYRSVVTSDNCGLGALEGAYEADDDPSMIGQGRLDHLSAQLMAAAAHWAPFASTHYLWLAPAALRLLSPLDAESKPQVFTFPNTISRLYSLLHLQGLLVLVDGLNLPAHSKAGLPMVWAASKRGVRWLHELWERPKAVHSMQNVLRHYPGICLQALMLSSSPVAGRSIDARHPNDGSGRNATRLVENILQS